MPGTPDGTKSHLDYWLYGIVKTAGQLGNVRLFLRAAQEVSIRKLLESEGGAFPGFTDPLEILRTYNALLDARGVLDAGDIRYRPVDDDLEVSIGKTCPPRGTCSWMHDEGGRIPCFRAIAMGEVLRIVGHRTCDSSLVRFDIPCRLRFSHLGVEASEDGD
ncbi:MAG TPA: hypothetical protein VEY12_12060 [Thermoplasmata archaeon]|nr:hypothetical protein [Thermoplasmata archaeon]